MITLGLVGMGSGTGVRNMAFVSGYKWSKDKDKRGNNHAKVEVATKIKINKQTNKQKEATDVIDCVSLRISSSTKCHNNIRKTFEKKTKKNLNLTKLLLNLFWGFGQITFTLSLSQLFNNDSTTWNSTTYGSSYLNGTRFD